MCRAMVGLAVGLVLLSGIAQARITVSPPALVNANDIGDDGGDLSPQVATDGLGNWVAVWNSTNTVNGTAGTDYDISVARSTDAGLSWSVPVLLNSNGISDVGWDFAPQVTTDGMGRWVVVWSSDEDLNGIAGVDRDICVARSIDNGATWTAPALLNTNGTSDARSDNDPQVTTDGAGHWVAVWQSNENLNGTAGTDDDVFVARSTNNGATWTAPALLNINGTTDTGSDEGPQVTTDGAGNWIAVWESEANLNGSADTDDDIFVARSTDNGANWSFPALLNTNGTADTGNDWNPQVTTDGSGHWVTVWLSNENLNGTAGTDYDIFVARSFDNGASWTAPAILNAYGTGDLWSDVAPEVTTDGAGNWAAVWHSSEDLGGTAGWDLDVFVSRSTDNGANWAAPALLHSNGTMDAGEDGYPQVTTDQSGHWVAVWQSTEDLNGTAGGDGDIFVEPSTDNGASWTAPDLLNANATADAHPDGDAQVTTDGAGTWIAVWSSGDYDISYRGGIFVARSTDNGVHWAAPSLLDTGGAGDEFDQVPQVTTDGMGNWVAVWATEGHDSWGDTTWALYTARSADNGVSWTDRARLNANGIPDGDWEWGPQVTTDGAGNWVAVWYSNHNLNGIAGTDADIFVSRSIDSGASWTPPALLNINGAIDVGGDAWPQLATDAAGQWIAVWESNENLNGTAGTDADIFVARSIDQGASWTAPVLLNSNGIADAGRDRAPQVTTDGMGNWVAAWGSNEYLSGSAGTDDDIFVARSTDNGASWTHPILLNTNGTLDAGFDLEPQVTTDGAGNWLAVWRSWEDLNGTADGDYDIFVSQSSDNGAHWTYPSLLNTNGTADIGSDEDPQVAADTAGNWVAVWDSDENLHGVAGTDRDIFVATIALGSAEPIGTPALGKVAAALLVLSIVALYVRRIRIRKVVQFDRDGNVID